MGRKRKSPRKHSVHTRHPRYNVLEYLRGKRGRGSCGGTPRFDGSGGGIGNRQNAKVIHDAYNLSSGTMATLTGKKKYSELDKIQNDFAQWVEGSPRDFNTWQEAWRAYEKETGGNY
ncbi:MAG: hypothetical protein ACTSPB_01425 [Candidatus Thorarchaeota archaeon]